MKLKVFLIFLIILFSINNIHSNNIDYQETSIRILDEEYLEITETLKIIVVDKSQEIILPIIPLKELRIDTIFKDVVYSYNLDNLTINVSNCCILNNSIYLDIIYVTDYFYLKEDDFYKIRYYPIFSDISDKFEVFLPNNKRIIEMSHSLDYISVLNEGFLIFLKDVNYFEVVFLDTELFKNNNNILEYIIIILIFIILFLIYLNYKKK